VQNDFYAYATFGANQAPILHQEKHYPETISMSMLRLVETKPQPCIKRSTIPKQTEPRFLLSLVT
jgi:hypothetical protein